jgi:hypothetical protein
MTPMLGRQHSPEVERMSATFLDDDEIATLTGRKMKGHQVAALRQMGIPFFINATGHPVVCRSAVEGGKKEVEQPKKTWVPKVLRTG